MMILLAKFSNKDFYLSVVKELHFDLGPSKVYDRLSRLKPSIRKMLDLPGLRSLLPVARQAASLTEPAGRISYRAEPSHVTGDLQNVITVLSANLYHDWPRHRQLQQRLEAFSQLIETEGVDVALLQEVSRTQSFRADSWLSERLGMAYVYSRANGHEQGIGFEEGLAIYSRFPLTSPILTELKPVMPFTRRVGLGANVETPQHSLPVFSVHLGVVPGQNSNQLKQLRRWIASCVGHEAALIGGDFNTHENSPQLAQTRGDWVDTFRHLHPAADGVTHEIRWPWGRSWRRRLDYLFLKPGVKRWQVLNARHIDAPGGPHSDHRAVLAQLAFFD